MSVWRPARQMARRSIRRNLGRSILIALLIGLPVSVATVGDVLYRSSESPAAYAHNVLGSADAKLVVTASSRIDHFELMSEWYSGIPYDEDRERRDPRDVDVVSLLPSGTRMEPVSTEGGASLLLRNGDRYDESWVESATMPSRFQPDRLELRSGKYPRPGEIAVTQKTADKLRIGPGDTVTDDLTGTELTVSGIVRDSQCLRCAGSYAQPGQEIVPRRTAESEVPWESRQRSYLLDLPAGADSVVLAHRLAEQGVLLFPRDTYLHRDDYRPGPPSMWEQTITVDQVRAAALTTVIVGLGLLEVVLLAGAAFAVGARKQIRDLGLIQAGGASPRQLRAVLLIQGAVLGVLGTVGGLLAGLVVVRLGWPLWELLNGSVLPVFRLGPELLIAVVVGVLSGVLAAVVPAVGAARMQPLHALSGRFRVSRDRSRRAGVLGGLGVLTGLGLGLVGSMLMADELSAYAESLAAAKQTGMSMTAPSPTLPIVLVLAGAVLAVAGLVLVMPVLLGALGRLGSRLPLTGRLAVRDADRHRHRTGPATSAVMLAVAGSVVAAFVIAGTQRGDEARWVPDLPDHTMQVHLSYDTDPAEQEALLDDAAQRAADLLPGGTVLGAVELGYRTPGTSPEEGDEAVQGVWFQTQAGCYSSCVIYGGDGMAAIADPTLVRLVLGRDLSADEQAALDRGEALALSPSLIGPKGEVTANIEEIYGPDGEIESPADAPVISLTAHLVERPTYYGSMPSVLISAETARSVGLEPVVGWNRLIAYSPEATRAEVRAAVREVRAGHRTGAYVPRPFERDDRVPLLVVGGLAALVTLIGVAIAVALSAAEGRRELATLSAVGAGPAVRRRLAGAQALVISGVGALVGVLLGTFVSYALRATFGAPSFTVPWANLLGVGLGVPLLAALITAACTCSRVPMLERRA